MRYVTREWFFFVLFFATIVNSEVRSVSRRL